MNPSQLYIAYMTIVRKEVVRFFRVWSQTLLPSAITTTLYYLIFGTFIGSRIGEMGGVSYMQFIVPGLVMMAVITNAFSNVVSSFYSAKFMKNVEEILVSPTPPWVVIAGFVTGGALRGILVGIIVLAISLFFTHLPVAHIGVILAFILMTSILFSLAGLVNGVFAKSFDGISIIPVFVLTPLTYLGGVFYSISLLPDFWQAVSKLNPILYMVNGFRYGFLGTSDVPVLASFNILLLMTVIMLIVILHLFRTGRGLRQ